MDATDRIVVEFNRLTTPGRSGVAVQPRANQFVYYIVATRCEIDIDGFCSVFEQDLNPKELEVLIQGLNAIGEPELASEFMQGYELLNAEGFYGHTNWTMVSSIVKDQIAAIGDRVADRLWALDDKLAAILESVVD
jgi:hypothetical protein